MHRNLKEIDLGRQIRTRRSVKKCHWQMRQSGQEHSDRENSQCISRALCERRTQPNAKDGRGASVETRLKPPTSNASACQGTPWLTMLLNGL